jgi:hypothetical protein
MDDMLVKFKKVIDEEIQAYESLGELYNIKQSVLVQGKSDVLWDIDAQILSKTDKIKEINQKRKEVAKYFGNEDLTMSEIIEKAKKADRIFANKLETQKTKLQILAKSLTLQEDTNMTLIKHGLTMVGKTLDIIVGAIMPQVQGGQYNSSGRSVDRDKSLISSVIEEA